MTRSDEPTAGDELDLEAEERLIAEAGGWTTWDGSGDAHVMVVDHVPQGWREYENGELEPPPLDDGAQARARRREYDRIARQMAAEGRAWDVASSPDPTARAAGAEMGLIGPMVDGRPAHIESTTPRDPRGRAHAPRLDAVEVYRQLAALLPGVAIAASQMEAMARIMEEASAAFEPAYAIRLDTLHEPRYLHDRYVLEVTESPQHFARPQRHAQTFVIPVEQYVRAADVGVMVHALAEQCLRLIIGDAGIDQRWATYLRAALRLIVRNLVERERGIQGQTPLAEIVDEISEFTARREQQLRIEAAQAPPGVREARTDHALHAEHERLSTPQDAPRDEDVVVGTQDASEEEFLAAMQNTTQED